MAGRERDDLMGNPSRTPEEWEDKRKRTSAERLRALLGRRSWDLSPGPGNLGPYREAVCIIAGVDPSRSFFVSGGDFGSAPLPGLLEAIGHVVRPAAPEERERFNDAILERLERFSSLPDLGPRRPAMVIAEALDRGLDVCWLEAALDDDECSHIHEWDELSRSVELRSKRIKRSEIESAKASKRHANDPMRQDMFDHGYPVFKKFENGLKKKRKTAEIVVDSIIEALDEEYPGGTTERFKRSTIHKYVREWRNGRDLPPSETESTP